MYGQSALWHAPVSTDLGCAKVSVLFIVLFYLLENVSQEFEHNSENQETYTNRC